MAAGLEMHHPSLKVIAQKHLVFAFSHKHPPSITWCSGQKHPATPSPTFFPRLLRTPLPSTPPVPHSPLFLPFSRPEKPQAEERKTITRSPPPSALHHHHKLQCVSRCNPCGLLLTRKQPVFQHGSLLPSVPAMRAGGGGCIRPAAVTPRAPHGRTVVGLTPPKFN